MELDWKSAYREYFLTRHKLCRNLPLGKAIRIINKKMGQILATHAIKYMDTDLAFTDFFIWPFGKGRRTTTIFKIYVNTATFQVSGFNPMAAKKILGIEPGCVSKRWHLLFLSKWQRGIFIASIGGAGTRTKVLKNILFMAADGRETPAQVYIRRISESTCRVLLVFRLRDCFIYRCSIPENFRTRSIGQIEAQEQSTKERLFNNVLAFYPY